MNARHAILTGANLENANLKNADLRFSVLDGANFSNANLEGVDLRYTLLLRCNFSRASFINAKCNGASFRFCSFQNSKLFNSNFDNSNIFRGLFENTHLKASSFNNAYFYITELNNAHLEDCCFENSTFLETVANHTIWNRCSVSPNALRHLHICNAELLDCILHQAVFDSTNFTHTSFFNTTFTDIEFRSTNLSYAVFDVCSFLDVHFYMANLSYATYPSVDFDRTLFSKTDLTTLIDAKINSMDEVSIDYTSIATTIASRIIHPLSIYSDSKLTDFLLRSGMPQLVAIYLIDSIRALNHCQLANIMRSTFISYGGPDEAFAKKLNSDLMTNGVKTFFFPLDASFGEKLHKTMRLVNDYDRIILICSKRSLNRPGLLNELEKVLEREAKEGGESFLIPINLDNYIFEWKAPRKELKDEILNRVVADFSDRDLYSTQLSRLLKALRRVDDSLLNAD